jgi:hypothetical protein
MVFLADPAKLLTMFAVDDNTATSIRGAFDECGELTAVVKFRRHFPLIDNNNYARRCVCGWSSGEAYATFTSFTGVCARMVRQSVESLFWLDKFICMIAFKGALLLLLGAAAVVVLGFLLLIANGISNGESINDENWPVFLGEIAVAGLLMLGAWQLGRRGSAGLGCLLLVLGFPASFVGFIIMLFVVSPGGHHW